VLYRLNGYHEERMKIRLTILKLARATTSRWPFKGRARLEKIAVLSLGLSGHLVNLEVATGLSIRVDIANRVEGMMYFRRYEPDVLKLFAEVLSEGDVAVDIGANVGFTAAMMAKSVGKSGTIHCFEPGSVPFKRLARFADDANANGYQIVTYNMGASHEKSTVQLNTSKSDNPGWLTMVPGLMSEASFSHAETIEVNRVDELLIEANITPKLVKIDVEGAELGVIKGLTALFDKKILPTIICEVAPNAYPYLGFDLDYLFDLMSKFGYVPTDTFGEPITSNSFQGTTNIIWRQPVGSSS
jgi:FkbM family methyltransferase